MINTRNAMLTCDNKLTTNRYYLRSRILPTPRTNPFVSNENNIKTNLRYVIDQVSYHLKNTNRKLIMLM